MSLLSRQVSMGKSLAKDRFNGIPIIGRSQRWQYGLTDKNMLYEFEVRCRADTFPTKKMENDEKIVSLPD
ncbi:MAG: hypothetical protein HOJ13_14250 [Nitrospina sp.]|nr:hypothetical protein [Nitrospina sp.]